MRVSSLSFPSYRDETRAGRARLGWTLGALRERTNAGAGGRGVRVTEGSRLGGARDQGAQAVVVGAVALVDGLLVDGPLARREGDAQQFPIWPLVFLYRCQGATAKEGKAKSLDKR